LSLSALRQFRIPKSETLPEKDDPSAMAPGSFAEGAVGTIRHPQPGQDSALSDMRFAQ